MKKICIDARMLSFSGIGTYLKNIVPKVIKNYSSILLVRKEDQKRFPWLKEFPLIFCSSSIYTLKEQCEFFSKIPKCDLFWSAHFNVPLLPIRAKKRLVTIHDVFHLAHFSRMSWREKLYAKKVYHAAVSKSKEIITDSHFSKGEIQKYLKVKKEKIQVIPCAVDQNLFKKMPIKKCEEILKRHRVHHPFYLFVGNFKPHKNLSNLLKAFMQISDHSHLVIIGKSKGFINGADLSEVLNQNPRLLEKVHILNNVGDQELVAFYQRAIAFVFPSLYEGFGLPILESMALDCPVIGSGCGSMKEVGKDAMEYFDPNDPEEIAYKMKKVAKDESLKNLLIQKGKEKIKEFSWEKSAKMHCKVIEKILA